MDAFSKIRPAPFFLSFIVRYWVGIGRPGDRLRTLLSILSVGLGVGVVLAIQLANRSAIGSFQSSLLEIAGRSNLSIFATNGIDELLLPRLRLTGSGKADTLETEPLLRARSSVG